MANSGLIKGSVSQRDSYYDSYIYWRESSQDITNNRTTIIVEVLVDSTSASMDWNGTVSNFSASINGVSYSEANFNSDSNSGWTYSTSTSPTGRVAERIWSKTVTITHNADGTKEVNMSCSFSLPSGGFGPGNVSVSGKGTLDTIPRASQPTLSASSTAMGNSVTIYTNRASTSFTHTLSYSFGSASGTIATGVHTSHAWTIPKTLANQIPNSTSGKGTITCKTYNGSTLIGTKSVEFTATVPNTTEFKPSFSSITHSDTVSTVSTNIGSYVQSQSKLALAITGAAGAYGSTISSYEITFDGTTYKSSNATSGAIKGSGTLTITGKVTDSRSRTYSSSISVTVLAYKAPVISSFTLERCNSDGTPNELGNYAKVYRAGTFNDLGTKNSVTIRIKSKLRTVSTWTENHSEPSTSGSFASTVVLGLFDVVNSYDFRVEVADLFNTTLALGVLPTSEVAMSWSTNGIGIGKVWERGAVDIGGDAYVSGSLNASKLNGGLTVQDVRDTNPTPDEIGSSEIKTFFNNQYGHTWMSGLTVAGGGTGHQVWQIGAPASTTDNELLRFRVGRGSIWGSWKDLSVIHSSESNSNGWYIRYLDGTQICYISTTRTDVAIDNNYHDGTGFDYQREQLWQGIWTWVFPASFVTGHSPTVTCSEFKWGTSASWGTVASKSNTAADLRGMDIVTRASGTTVYISAMAIGRWK